MEINGLLSGNKRTVKWMQEIKTAVEEKRMAYKKTLQRNVPEAVRERRKREYRDGKVKVKTRRRISNINRTNGGKEDRRERGEVYDKAVLEDRLGQSRLR